MPHTSPFISTFFFTCTKVQILTQAAAEEHRATHIPGTIGYKISDVMTDLVNLAVKYLRVCVCAPMRGVDGVLLTHICGPMCVCVWPRV